MGRAPAVWEAGKQSGGYIGAFISTQDGTQRIPPHRTLVVHMFAKGGACVLGRFMRTDRWQLRGVLYWADNRQKKDSEVNCERNNHRATFVQKYVTNIPELRYKKCS